MDKKEKIIYFNQCFKTFVNKFPIDSQPTKSVIVEWYTSVLHPSIAMFVNRNGKTILSKKFDKSKKVEKEMSGVVGNLVGDKTKAPGFTQKPLLLTNIGEKYAIDLDSVVTLVKKISNKIVDLKKNYWEGTSSNSFREDMSLVDQFNDISDKLNPWQVIDH